MKTLHSSLNFYRLSVGQLAWVCFLSCIIAIGLPAKAQATVKILQTVWTNGINDKNQPRAHYQRVASTNSLYLWMQIKGTDLIKYKWYRYIGSRAYLDHVKTPQRVKQYVWSGKEKIQPGWWRVNVIYARSKRPVRCGRSPCVFKIRVVR